MSLVFDSLEEKQTKCRVFIRLLLIRSTRKKNRSGRIMTKFHCWKINSFLRALTNQWFQTEVLRQRVQIFLITGLFVCSRQGGIAHSQYHLDALWQYLCSADQGDQNLHGKCCQVEGPVMGTSGITMGSVDLHVNPSTTSLKSFQGLVLGFECHGGNYRNPDRLPNRSTTIIDTCFPPCRGLLQRSVFTAFSSAGGIGLSKTTKLFNAQ